MTSAQQPPAPQRRFDSLEQEAFLNLWRTYDRLHIAEEALFEQYELTPQQYNALRLLRSESPAKVATLALAERLVSRAPDITRLLDKLVVRGLVERERPAADVRHHQIGDPVVVASQIELGEPGAREHDPLSVADRDGSPWHLDGRRHVRLTCEVVLRVSRRWEQVACAEVQP